jgi:hypothetical protein
MSNLLAFDSCIVLLHLLVVASPRILFIQLFRHFRKAFCLGLVPVLVHPYSTSKSRQEVRYAKLRRLLNFWLLFSHDTHIPKVNDIDMINLQILAHQVRFNIPVCATLIMLLVQ